MIKKLFPASILAMILSVALPINTLSVGAIEYFSESESIIEGSNLEISASYDSKLTIPLSLNTSAPFFCCDANLSPGDIAKSTVLLQNTSDIPISISITDIENQLTEDEKANLLLDVLEVTIDIDGQTYYQGKHSELSMPFMPFVEIAPEESISLNISMKFPREADNRYQGAKYKMKWVFEAMAEPVIETTIPEPIVTEAPPEPVKTGVEDTSSSTPLAIPSIVIAFALTGVLALNHFKKKK